MYQQQKITIRGGISSLTFYQNISSKTQVPQFLSGIVTSGLAEPQTAERERQTERQRQTDRLSLCVCVCV